MNPLRCMCLVACLLAAVVASPRSNSLRNGMKPSDWLSVSELDGLPAINEVDLEELERMSLDDGASLVNKIYHLSQVNEVFEPTYEPSPQNIPGYLISKNGQKIAFNLQTLVSTVKEQDNFGDEEVTIFITGLPQNTHTVRKANRKLVQAYMQRYSNTPFQSEDYNDSDNVKTSSEENENNGSMGGRNRGNFLVIDLGATITSYERYTTMNVDGVGQAIGRVLVKLTNEVDVPQEVIHIIGQSIGAHVAGEAAREFTRLTGHKLRRITALDPSKIYAKSDKKLTGLARGLADFVDAIHTSAYGMGTATRVGDVDYYPNGPNTGVPGAANIVEAAMRATRYFAESVRPGNERNFPAVAASSLQEYKQNNGYGKRAYMGIGTEFDISGDYILQVNAKSPFGKNAPAKKQRSYHAAHQPWNQSQGQANQQQRKNRNN